MRVVTLPKYVHYSYDTAREVTVEVVGRISKVGKIIGVIIWVGAGVVGLSYIVAAG